MSLTKFMATLGTAAILTACAQTETTMVRPEPVFDKYGNGSCQEGWIYTPGAAPQQLCVPEDECLQPVQTASGIYCPPVYRQPQDDGRDDNDRGRQPVGTAPQN
ncbi:hypothetical protein EF888_11675 [Silicimonas algicola]|nr:hypothetical protein [Silicimonas algicola]AZQ67735.1 hypothetical protein EF888_11675 [Silicimonas algicola]